MARDMTRRGFVMAMAGAASTAFLAGCAGGQSSSSATSATSAESTSSATSASADAAAVDYKILINKKHAIPDDWESRIKLVHHDNVADWGTDVEAKAYDAFLALKKDLEADDVHIDLDSAYRSVESQQKVWDEFTEKYGAEYTKQHVAPPHYSEHHTGLALDLFLIIDGKNVYENEDMVQHPDIWEKVHAKLADHGFILRYLPEKKIETGYSYEPWHLRYLDDVDLAHQVADAGVTYERFLNDLDASIADCVVDYGSSTLYIESDMDAALDGILEEFGGWKGCVLQRLAYAGDEACGADEVAYVNSLREEGAEEFKQAMVFESEFHSPSAADAEGTAWEPDTDYKGWTWHLGRTGEQGGWKLVGFGQG